MPRLLSVEKRKIYSSVVQTKSMHSLHATAAACEISLRKTKIFVLHSHAERTGVRFSSGVRSDESDVTDADRYEESAEESACATNALCNVRCARLWANFAQLQWQLSPRASGQAPSQPLSAAVGLAVDVGPKGWANVPRTCTPVRSRPRWRGRRCR
jgi:hypothetical protein